MSKVTYLLGAGASYGKRKYDEKGEAIERGLPIIHEIPMAINQILRKLCADPILCNGSMKIQNELRWLKEKCLEYPTIDTYAKILYVNGTGVDVEYIRLKRALALFFLLFQDKSKRDLRYDNFVASIIGNSKELPPVDILTWNYDAQLEFAFSEYFPGSGIEDLWKNKLNVCDKTYFHRYFQKESSFSITKLNGTAFFEQNDLNEYTRVVDMLLSKMSLEEKIAKAHEIIDSECNLNDLNLPQCGISYVWERGLDHEFFPNIEERIKDAEILVVIGYSFPYVNRPTDKRLLSAMINLRKIYIQDPRASQVSETISTLCHVPLDCMVLANADNQFVIPYELELHYQ